MKGTTQEYFFIPPRLEQWSDRARQLADRRLGSHLAAIEHALDEAASPHLWLERYRAGLTRADLWL
jgi:hypothetical protein